MDTDLETLKNRLDTFVATDIVKKSGIKSYHIIRMNQTLNPSYATMPSENIMWVSDEWLVQEFPDATKRPTPLYTAMVTPD